MLRIRRGARRPARAVLAAAVLATGVVAVNPSIGATEAPAASDGEFPRNETVITSGTQWGPPSSWNPLQGGGQAMGVRGLL